MPLLEVVQTHQISALNRVSHKLYSDGVTLLIFLSTPRTPHKPSRRAPLLTIGGNHEWPTGECVYANLNVRFSGLDK